jgi:hypothetical protein
VTIVLAPQAYAPRHRSEWLGKIQEAGVRRRAEFYYQQFDALRSLRQEVRYDLWAEANKHSATRLLREIPFIGPFRAALLIALLQTPHRFRPNHGEHLVTELLVGFRTDWPLREEAMKTAGRGTQTHCATRRSQPSTWGGRLEQILLNHAGWKVTKNPAAGVSSPCARLTKAHEVP